MIYVITYLQEIIETAALPAKLKQSDIKKFQHELFHVNPVDDLHPPNHLNHPDSVQSQYRIRRGIGYRMKCVPALKHFCNTIHFKTMKQMYCVTVMTSRCTGLD